MTPTTEGTMYQEAQAVRENPMAVVLKATEAIQQETENLSVRLRRAVDVLLGAEPEKEVGEGTRPTSGMLDSCAASLQHSLGNLNDMRRAVVRLEGMTGSDRPTLNESPELRTLARQRLG